ncbi:probable G-protein coupled receptor 179 [Alligator mississippiensis]|uniref:probable G-protein coupled receptor 179 n=1 Tax=Alligator mississippiensis TaxID=8496 RepID=UPI0006EC5F0F|nr:probable G-protein coupled receptor 179 [Alligator mississippiensis]
MGCWMWPLLWYAHMVLAWGAGIFQHQKLPPVKTRTSKAKEWVAPSSASTWATSPESDKVDLEVFDAALAFLHSGDTLRLSHANCSQRFEVWDMGRATSPPEALRASLRGATDTLAHATNFLNMIFQTNDIRESSVKEDVEWYQALVRSLIEGDAQIHRAVLTFDAHPMSSKPQLMLQATKKKDEILLQDLSGSTEGLRNLSRENEWFNALKSQQALFLHKRVLNNDLQSLDTPKWNRGDSYMMDTNHVRWSPPFLECEDSKFLPTWMVTLSSSFYGLKPDLSPEFKGVVRMDIKLQNVDINQCARGTGWFSDTHRCDLNSTQCVPQESRGFVLGRYLCLCKPGFYGASRSPITAQPGIEKSSSQYGEVSPGNLLECRPCQEGCVTCVDDTPCLIQEDWSLRAAVLSCQAFCMLAVFLSMLISYHFRKSKRIRASGVILLETILFGSLLLYFPVFILYFKPSIFRCIVLRWVRMLGFAIVYGTITLKLYRVLKVFLSRTAQRVPYMTSGRVMKMLGLILLLVLWFLAAWTVGMLENIDKNIPLVIRSQTPRGLQFYICDHDRWDYMMVVAEMLFLLWGSFLCYATRTVPSAFHEPRYMGIALHNELIISTAFHVIRFVMVPSLHPDWTLLLFFIHTHVTITMTLALLFIPKFLHAGSPLREEIAAEVYEDELDMRRSGSYLNSSITSAWSEHSLDPDDIREELKKLYTQLEVHKTKKMTANNPHLQKKRSSKKGLGRSFMRRITELPESMSRKEEKDGSLTGGSRSHSGSYKRRLLDSGSSSMKMKDDPSKRKPFSLRKSHSTYDHVRDPKDSSPPRRESTCKDPSLLDSLMRKNLAKKASERSNSDSLDSAPLVYKSASAHNLSADKRPLHPKPSPLQKSLSVITSAKDKALLLPSRAYLEDSYQQTREEKKIEEGASTPETQCLRYTDGGEAASQTTKQPECKNVSEGTLSTLLQDSFDKAEVCPWEVEEPVSESKSQKHVTYAPIKSISVDSSHLSGRMHPPSKRTPPEPPIRYQSLSHNLEKSEAAPWNVQEQKQSPADAVSKDAKEAPELLNTWEVEKLPRKAEIADKGRSEQREGRAQMSSTTGKNKLTTLPSVAAEVSPWEAEACNQDQHDEPTEPGDSKKPSTSSAAPQNLKLLCRKNSFKSLGLAIKALNRPKAKSSIKGKKEGEGSQKKKDRDRSSRRDNSKVVETSAVAIRETAKQNDRAKGPDESQQKMVIRQATICPWEEQETIPNQQNNNSSKVFETCPLEVSKEKPEGPQNESASSKGSARTERRSLKDTRDTTDSNLEKMRSQWEITCPQESTDSYGVPEKLSKPKNKISDQSNINPNVGSKKAEAQPRAAAEAKPSVKSEICPWEGAGIPSKKQQELSKEDRSVMQKAATGLGKTMEKGSSQESVCPQESLDMDKPSLKPGTRSQDLSEASLKKPDRLESKKIEVSPWETKEIETSIQAEIGSWEVTEAPPDPGKLRQNKGEVSKESKSTPLPAGPSTRLEKGSSQQEVVCPWESLDMEELCTKLKVQSPGLSNAASKKSESVESKRAEICPWEMEEDNISIRKMNCPWEERESPTGKGKLGKNTGEDTKGDHRDTLKRPSPREKKLQLMSQQEAICPWESTDMEALSASPQTQSPALSKVGSRKSESLETKRAEVCPWEVEEADSKARAEICPWEESETPSEKGVTKPDKERPFKEEKSITPEARGPSKTIEKGSSQREVICPWESLDMEALSAKPDAQSPGLHKVGSRKSDSTESKRAEICPWEMEEVDSRVRSEICPWEGSETPSDKKKLKRQIGRASKGEKKGSRGSEDITLKKKKGSSPQDSTSSWGSLDTEVSTINPNIKKTHQFKIPSKKSESAESRKAEICPWEMEGVDTSIRAEICPWEMVESPSEERERKQDTGGAFKEDKSITTQAALASSSTALEKLSNQREAICPWESIDMNELSVKPGSRNSILSKDASKKSESLESKRAEVCPWESVELDSSIQAEICPWEASEVPSHKAKLKKDKDGTFKTSKDISPKTSRAKEIGGSTLKKPEKGDSEQEAICPWESLDMEKLSTKLKGQSPGLTKAASKKSESVESKRAEICPWETEEVDTSIGKTNCPWEGRESLTGKEKLGKNTGEDTKEDHKEALKKPDSRKTGGTTSKKLQLMSQQEAICPWESTDMEALSTYSWAQSPALSKAGSRKSESLESKRAEVCPWEVEEADSKVRAEICPWEESEVPPEKGVTKPDKERSSNGGKSITNVTGPSKTMEKGSSQREVICPWESLDMEESFVQPCPKNRDSTKGSTKKSVSVDSKRAEVCPWETEEAKSSIKSKICPQEVTGASSDQGKLREGMGRVSKENNSTGSQRTGDITYKSLEKEKTLQESICLWESLDMDNSSIKAVPGAIISKRSDSAESKRSDICPWEAVELGVVGKKSIKEEVCPWDVAGASSVQMEKQAVEAASATGPETSTVQLSKPTSRQGQAAHQPLHRILPDSQPLRALSRGSSTMVEVLPWQGAPVTAKHLSKGSTVVVDVCPWVLEGALTDHTETSQNLKVCPWEAKDIGPIHAMQSKSKSAEKMREEAKGLSQSKTDICPWDYK